MFKKNKRKYIKLGNVIDKKKEIKQVSSSPIFDGEKICKAFNQIKVEEVIYVKRRTK